MAIVLTVSESSNQLISGIPEYIEVESNIPSTMFYTIDGTTPDQNSEIIVGKLTLPTDGLTFTLKIVAISGSERSSVFEETYYTDNSNLNRTRNIGNEGLNILQPGREVVSSLGYTSSGEDARSSVIEPVDLDYKVSKTDRLGEAIDGTTLDFVNFQNREDKLQGEESSSSSPKYADFDPKSFLIVVDGSTEEKLNSQIVRVINRPHGTIEPVNPYYHEKKRYGEGLVTGSFVRAMYNPITGKMVCYYRESRDSRWLKSIQQTEPKILYFDTKESMPNSLVFRWVDDRNMSKIY